MFQVGSRQVHGVFPFPLPLGIEGKDSEHRSTYLEGVQGTIKSNASAWS